MILFFRCLTATDLYNGIINDMKKTYNMRNKEI
jgi:hypothetical protein